MFCVLLLIYCALFCCLGHQVPDFNITISNNLNQTGHLHAKVQLELREEKSWQVAIGHKTLNHNDTKYVIIESDVTAPLDQWSVIEQGCVKSETENEIPKKNMSAAQRSALIKLGYELLSGFGYYKAHRERRIWADDVALCDQEGTHLLILNSDEEAHKIGEFITRHGLESVDVWVGVHDRYKEGDWVTIFNESLESTGFSRWGNREPAGGTSENCMLFDYTSSSNYGLYDVPCTQLEDFVCEKEL